MRSVDMSSGCFARCRHAHDHSDEDDWTRFSARSSSTCSDKTPEDDDQVENSFNDDDDENDSILVSPADSEETEEEESCSRGESEVQVNRIPSLPIVSKSKRKLRRCPSYLHHRHEYAFYRPQQRAPEIEAVAQQTNDALWNEDSFPREIGDNITEEDNNGDYESFMHVLYYTSVPIALAAIPLTVVLLGYSTIAQCLTCSKKEKDEQLLLYLILIGIPGLIASIICIYNGVGREDCQTSSSGSPHLATIMEKQLIQLLAACLIFLCIYFMNQMFLPIGYIQVRNISSFINLAIKWFIISFSVAFSIDVPLRLYRTFKTDSIFGEILSFELAAYLLPTLYVACPFLILNLVALLLPRQPFWIWFLLHVVAYSWILVVVVGLLQYPEITVRRRHGLLGYVYMLLVSLLQTVLVENFIFSICLMYFLHLEYLSLPSYQLKSAQEIKISIGGVAMYLGQIFNNVPVEQWRSQYPYPITFDNFKLITLLVCDLRLLNLVWRILGYRAEIDNSE